MKKSINDIDEQAERIIAKAEGSRFFKAAKYGVCRSAIYKLARKAKMQHGFGFFDTDKTTKRECIHPYVNNCAVYTAWWDKPEYKQQMEKLQAKLKKEREEEEEKRKAHRQCTREQLEQKLNQVVDAQMMCKVLAWIQQSIVLHTQLGLAGDPYDVPRKLMTECINILPHEGKQLNLF